MHWESSLLIGGDRRELHTRSQPASEKTAESSGKSYPPVADTSLPCAPIPPCAHGSMLSMHSVPGRSSEFQGYMSLSLAAPTSPMCSFHGRTHPSCLVPRADRRKQADREPQPPPGKGRPPSRTSALHRDRLAPLRISFQLDGGAARFGRGGRSRRRKPREPISSRNRTDLGAEYDRSRRRAGSERQEGSK